MKIALCAAEAVPFVKVGGLGDVMGALPGEFAAAGHEVIVILPAYGQIDRKIYPLREIHGIGEQLLSMGSETLSYRILEYRREPNSGVRYLFIENARFFEREAVYSHRNNRPFADEGSMWAFFQLAVLNSLVTLGFKADILHVHDMHTAFLPALIRFHHADFFRGTRTVLTLHNLLFQGVYPYEIYQKLNMPEQAFYPMSDFEYFGKTNFVKSGLIYANAVNTVSPNYAAEILDNPGYSYGLWDLIRSHQGKFRGILNGADYNYWNPEKDPHLHCNYGPETLDRKAECRENLLEKCGMKAGKNTMVLGIVARMTKQKGFQLLLDALPEIMRRKVVLIILASGDEELEKAWELQQVYYPDRIHYEKAFNEELSHRIQSGVDLFLMPSHFEPCGLSQMYAMKYGTPPLAFATGGLVDTITDSGVDRSGFLFRNYRVKDLVDALDDAVNHFNYPVWERVQLNGMAREFSWSKSASEYLSMFDFARGRGNGGS